MLKIKPIRDRKYLNSYRDASCYACGACDGTVVGAHIRRGFFGLGIKPDDSLTLPLCAKCHAEEGASEPLFWQKVYSRCLVITPRSAIALAKKCARHRYAMWKEKQQ